MIIPADLLDAAAIDLARRRFYYFCRILYPRFYTEDKTHLRILCDTLQDFYEDKILESNGQPIKNLILNLPPRFGKSYTTQNFCKWILGRDNSQSMITVSYNQTLSMRAGKEVRNAIMERRIEGGRVTYSDIFPDTLIKDGDGAADVWSLEGSHFSYLSTSPTGTLTGIGCKWLIIDDLVKDAYEANHAGILQGQWDWYTDTALSRLESGGKKLLIMTRWSTKDLAGRVLDFEGDKWHVIKLPACLDESKEIMLCPSILSFSEYCDRKKKTDPQIFMSNYQQEPFDSVDRLYPVFKTYDVRPEKFEQICSYTDTADEGQDSLSTIVYGIANSTAFVLDVLHTKAAMETTEPMVANMLTANAVEKSWVESNNGGRGFARNVERIMRGMGNHRTAVEWFHQSENKQARILSNASSAINSIIFPLGWEYRWPEFFNELASMSRTEKWAHDDAADALTGVVEKSLSNNDFRIL